MMALDASGAAPRVVWSLPTGYVNACPLLTATGVLFATLSGVNGTNFSTLMAVNATSGAVLWTVPADPVSGPGEYPEGSRAPPHVSRDGTLVYWIGQWQGLSLAVFAHNATTGQLVWQRAMPGGAALQLVLGAPASDPAVSTRLFLNTPTRLMVLDALTGASLAADLSIGSLVSPVVSADGARVYVTPHGSNGYAGGVACVGTASVAVLWTFRKSGAQCSQVIACSLAARAAQAPGRS
jgi:outer membrane protein assembly factor BamB